MMTIICIGCPQGCELQVSGDCCDRGSLQVRGNACRRGIDYAKEEIFNPRRIITTTVRVRNGRLVRVPVRSAEAIPKGRVFLALEEVKQVILDAPVKMGQVVLQSVAGTGVSVITTRPVEVVQDAGEPGA